MVLYGFLGFVGFFCFFRVLAGFYIGFVRFFLGFW